MSSIVVAGDTSGSVTLSAPAVAGEQVASYEANVASQIEAQINPSIVTPPLPWTG